MQHKRNGKTMVRRRPRRSGMQPRLRLQQPRPFTFIPPQAASRARLVWSGQMALSEAAANTGIIRLFRLNSPYDVDTTVGSTSTPGFAEYSAFFANYRVWSTKVMAEVSANGGTTGSLATVVMFPFPAGSVAVTSTTWSVQPYALHRTIQSIATNGGRNMTTLKGTFHLPSIARITPQQYLNEKDYSSTVSNNPVQSLSLGVGGYGLNSASAITFTIQIYVQFEVEFFNPIPLSA